MRIIKFRAWDKEEKRMLEDVCTNTDDFTDMLNETFAYWQDEEIGTLELMQFTGLLDKSGKEIYEGDVVKLGRLNGYWEVIWDQEVAGFRMKQATSETGYGFYVNDHPILIVSNIYSNPGLLKP